MNWYESEKFLVTHARLWMVVLKNRPDVLNSFKSLSFDPRFCCGRHLSTAEIKKFVAACLDHECLEGAGVHDHSTLLVVVAAKTAESLCQSLVMRSGQWIVHSRPLLSSLTARRQLLLEKRYGGKQSRGSGACLDDVINVLDFFMLLLQCRVLELSKFRSHEKLLQILCSQFKAGGSKPGVLADQCLYLVWSVRSSKFYIGETVAGFQVRKRQHLRYASCPQTYKKQQLPLYRWCRKNFGMASWHVTPLISVPEGSKLQLKRLESQLIHRTQAPLNSPFVQGS